jgi:hypothetical protein
MAQMNATQLIEKLERQMQKGELNWQEARSDIHAAHKNATTEAERVLCLDLHNVVLDAVERDEGTIIPEKMEDFRKTRQQDYDLLLVSEAMIGRTDGIIDPVVMRRITEREVAAGRMAEDDDLRKLTIEYTAKAAAGSQRGILSKIKSWFRRRG